MYRLACSMGNGEKGERLTYLAQYLITETLKGNLLRSYLKKGSEAIILKAINEPNSIETIKACVNQRIAPGLVTPITRYRIEQDGHDIADYVSLYLAELVQVLYAEESLTPGEFTEYLIYRMGIKAEAKGYFLDPKLDPYIDEFETLLREYVPQEIQALKDELEDGQELDEHTLNVDLRIDAYIEAVTNLDCLMNCGVDDLSLILWDTDFLIFNK